MEDEIWKDIPSVPQMMASSWGRVRLKPYSVKMPNGIGVRHYNPKPRVGVEQKGATGRAGVPKRRLIYITGLRKTFIVARLVCEAFHGPAPYEGAVAMHLDEDPSHNQPSNLQWGTQQENMNMPKAVQAFKARKGEKSPRSIGNQRRKAA